MKAHTMKTIFMFTDDHLGGAQNTCRDMAEHLQKRGVDARIVDTSQWRPKINPGMKRRVMSLFNMARGVRKLARENPDAIFFASQHVFGIPCFFVGVPCHTKFANDPRRKISRLAWIIYSHMLLWHKKSRLYLMHQSLLDDCPAKPLWGRKRMRVLENPTPQLAMAAPAFTEEKFIDAVFVGRLHESKNLMGLMHLIERCGFAFKTLRIFGDGPDRDSFKSALEASSIPRRSKIEFNSWQKNPWALIDRPSVMFITSHYEGWGRVVTEAFASGIPVISTVPSPSTRFLVSEGRGLDLAGMDEAAVVEAARKFLYNPDVLNETRARARAWIEARQKIDYGAYLHDTLFGKDV